jgi:RHS repeat-associated protein
MGTVRYTTVNGEIIAEKRSGVRRLYVPDPLGSTVALLNNTQTQTDTFKYWPYGEEVSRTGTTPTPFRFGGPQGYYRNSAETIYVRARHFTTRMSRWLTPDPIRFNGGDANLYRYVKSNPTWGTDRYGLAPAGCNPVVYHCCRPASPWPLIHCLLWIHYPCNDRPDTTISYGPPAGYRRSTPPVQPDDMGAIRNGTASCRRTNCNADCIIPIGREIGFGQPRWDPDVYFWYFFFWDPFVPGQPATSCWTFPFYAMEKCNCAEGGPKFTPNRRPVKYPPREIPTGPTYP